MSELWLPLQTAAIHMVGGGLGRQTTKNTVLRPDHQIDTVLHPRPPKLCGLPCQPTTGRSSSGGLLHQTANDWRFGVANHHFPKKEWWSGLANLESVTVCWLNSSGACLCVTIRRVSCEVPWSRSPLHISCEIESLRPKVARRGHYALPQPALR